MVTFGGYWLGVAFFMLLDYAQWPHFLYKYKINPGENAPPPTSKVIKVNGSRFKIMRGYNDFNLIPRIMLNFRC